ncbi:MAG TPA: PIG-L deacetylase family protein [Acidimicrobiales bacterium]|nr:PIG-L deacetylase family protein [Acidimicrobiales bacterium]
MTTNLERPSRALAIAAHPDDVEFGCGGTLAKWSAEGTEIFHLICTDGSKGTWKRDQDPQELVLIRREEQRAAARRLGGTGEVIFLGWPDGELESGLRQRVQVASWIRRIRPGVVFAHDPWKRYRLHPDHRNAGFLATDGIVAARDPLFFPEINLESHRPDHLLLWEADEVDHLEEVSSSLETKIAALLEHASQFQTTMHISEGDGPEAIDEQETFRRRIMERLAEAGAAEGLSYAEGFKRIDRL